MVVDKQVVICVFATKMLRYLASFYLSVYVIVAPVYWLCFPQCIQYLYEAYYLIYCVTYILNYVFL